MRTKSLFIAALLTMVTIVTAVGKDEPGTVGLAVVPVKGSEVFKVIYKGESTGKVKLNIYNAKAELIFTQTLTTDGFIRPLNFSGLEFGEYSIELIDASGKRVEKVSHKPYVPESKDVKSDKFVHISKLANSQGKFLLAVANAGTETINVKIYDADNKLVHSEERQVSGEFAQLYNIKNVSGVTFQISDNTGNIKTSRF